MWARLYKNNMAVHRVACVENSGCKVHGVIVLQSCLFTIKFVM